MRRSGLAPPDQRPSSYDDHAVPLMLTLGYSAGKESRPWRGHRVSKGRQGFALLHGTEVPALAQATD
jgi:hypothetical protein